MSRILILMFFIYLLGFYVFGQAALMSITTQAAPVALKAAHQVGVGRKGKAAGGIGGSR